MTDPDWLILAPVLPAPRPCGCPRKWAMREIVNAIFHVLRGGIVWSLLPKVFPPWPAAHRWFAGFRDDGAWDRINHHLVRLDRERAGREASPAAPAIDSQSVKATESGGVRGYDAGKKIKGRKGRALADGDGRALKLQAHSAGIQDRDGAGPLLRASRPSWPFGAPGDADGGYAGPRAAQASPLRIQVVSKADDQVGFAVTARRWVVERLFAWINRNRRLAKDFEATTESVEALLHAASTVILPRRLAHG